jgi:signal-transduction protein with cAMP-binding, CBS, and nucleotidyltransferase domain
MTTTHTSPRIDQLPRRPLVTVEPATSLRSAARLMRAEDVSALVVGKPGDLITIVTERDMTRAVAEGRDGATPVAEVASPRPVTVEGGTTVVTAATRMLQQGVRHLVVVDRARAVGLVSMRDALAVLLQSVTPDPGFLVLRSVEPDATELWLG